MQSLFMYNSYSCTTISFLVIPSENAEIVWTFTVCNDGCITFTYYQQILLLCVYFTVVSEYVIVMAISFIDILCESRWYVVRLRRFWSF